MHRHNLLSSAMILLIGLALVAVGSSETDKEIVDGMISGKRPFTLSTNLDTGNVFVVVYGADSDKIDLEQIYVFEVPSKNLEMAKKKLYLHDAVKLKDKWPNQGQYLENLDKTDLHSLRAILFHDSDNVYMMHLMQRTHNFNFELFNISNGEDGPPKYTKIPSRSIGGKPSFFSTAEKHPCFYYYNTEMRRLCFMTKHHDKVVKSVDEGYVVGPDGPNQYICKSKDEQEGTFEFTNEDCTKDPKVKRARMTSVNDGSILEIVSGHLDADGKMIAFGKSNVYLTAAAVRRKDVTERIQEMKLSDMLVAGKPGKGGNGTNVKPSGSINYRLIGIIGGIVLIVLVVVSCIACMLNQKKSKNLRSISASKGAKNKKNLKMDNLKSPKKSSAKSAIKSSVSLCATSDVSTFTHGPSTTIRSKAPTKKIKISIKT